MPYIAYNICLRQHDILGMYTIHATSSRTYDTSYIYILYMTSNIIVTYDMWKPMKDIWHMIYVSIRLYMTYKYWCDGTYSYIWFDMNDTWHDIISSWVVICRIRVVICIFFELQWNIIMESMSYFLIKWCKLHFKHICNQLLFVPGLQPVLGFQYRHVFVASIAAITKKQYISSHLGFVLLAKRKQSMRQRTTSMAVKCSATKMFLLDIHRHPSIPPPAFQ